ncbi:hypothetical protein PTT_02592 [Pyrenophora teres f. teres 0-1]|uniref:Uncharacterized protein n=1 Tax=Pyrenophora teres f. teres (strain 0-1) TaxID=861557 RepID=E3RDN4_PYRTT|nr:hypothetical protein PTT_02592 [Pyrenophora teres f. teres 0-1]
MVHDASPAQQQVLVSSKKGRCGVALGHLGAARGGAVQRWPFAADKAAFCMTLSAPSASASVAT